MNLIVIFVEAAIVLLLLFSAYYCYYSWKTGVPTVSTSKEVRKKMAELIPPGPQRIVEMGAGWGGLALAAAKARPDCTVLAIEYSVVPWFVSRLRAALDPSLKNVQFRRGDFFDFSLKNTDVVFCYLLEPMLAKLAPKFLSELPAHALIICNHYRIPGWTPVRTEKIDKFFEKNLLVYDKESAKGAA